jgi:glycosyltransferase involved in cell wall biosynthesis
MRILNVTQTYAPFLEFGGPPIKVRSLSRALVKRGHHVTVLTADWGFEERVDRASTESSKAGVIATEPCGIAQPGSAQPVTNGVSDLSPFGWRLEEEGVKSIYLPIWYRRRALSWNPSIKRFLRSQLQHFDVAHIFGLYDLLGPATAAACRRQGIPYVVEPMGMSIPIVRSFWQKRVYHSFLGKQMIAGANFVVATSEQEAGELRAARLADAKVTLRRNGVDVPAELPKRDTFRAAHKIPANTFVILFLGRLSAKKSPELLLEAFASLVRSSKRPLRLVFAGPDEDGMSNRLRKAAGQLGVGEQVLLCGPVFEEDKWSAYCDADIFVLPSQNENFGNSAAEAMAMGTPVIVTEQCGIAPLLKDVAGLVVAHDAEAVCGAMRQMLTEPTLRERFVSGCREVTSRLSWDEPAAEMEFMYAQMMASPPEKK